MTRSPIASRPSEERSWPIDPRSVTVAIETWNVREKSWEVFAQCVESLKAQTYPFRQCEILVSLDRHDHREAKWIRKLLPEAKLVWLRGATYYRSKNLALQAAHGEFIVLADCDVSYEPRWLESLLAAFRPGIGSGGRLHTLPAWLPFQKLGRE